MSLWLLKFKFGYRRVHSLTQLADVADREANWAVPETTSFPKLFQLELHLRNLLKEFDGLIVFKGGYRYFLVDFILRSLLEEQFCLQKELGWAPLRVIF